MARTPLTRQGAIGTGANAGVVLVTGGSGYIAGFLIKQLVERGWAVRATVRDLSKEAKTRAALDIHDDRVRFFALQLEDDDGWAEAMAGCSHVAHVASPFPLGKVTDAMLVPPARDGVLRALRFARNAGVARFVQTSSVAAIAFGQSKTLYDESDWTNIQSPHVQPYVRSKTVAERAARDWVSTHSGSMEFCSVNPGAVLGPVMSDDFSSSIQLVQRLLDGSAPIYPRIGFPIVDVRDLADLHVRALETPGIAGERFIGAGRVVMMKEVCEVLRAHLGPQARRVPTRQAPDLLLRMLAPFDGSIRQIVSELGRPNAVDPSHTKRVLGWQTRPAEESILDTARSLIEHGLVDRGGSHAAPARIDTKPHSSRQAEA